MSNDLQPLSNQQAPSADISIAAQQPIYAGIFRRGVAELIDLAVAFGIYGIATVVLILPSFLISKAFGIDSHSPIELLLFIWIVFELIPKLAAIGIYFALMESSPVQATLGKLALGIRVTDLAGKRISKKRAFVRFAAMFLRPLTLGVVSLFTVLLSHKKQDLHDMIAKTLVVRKPTNTRGGINQVSALVLSAGVMMIAVGCDSQHSQSATQRGNPLEKQAVETIQFYDHSDVLPSRFSASPNLLPRFGSLDLPGLQIGDRKYLLTLTEIKNSGIDFVWIVGGMRLADLSATNFPDGVLEDIERMRGYIARDHGSPSYTRTNLNPQKVDSVHKKLVAYKWVMGKKEIVIAARLIPAEGKASANTYISYDVLPSAKPYSTNEISDP